MISVIVCTYNRAEYLYKCLSCVAQNETAIDWELLLIDNNSTDNTYIEWERFLTDFPSCNALYFRESKQGLSYARNRGIKESKGEWVVFLDDDAFVRKDYLENINNFLQNYQDADAFGGAVIPLFEAGKPKWYSLWSKGFVSAIDKGKKVVQFKKGEFPVGANMGIRKNVFQKYGLFNTELGRTGNNLLAGEEKDIFNRILQGGGIVYYIPCIAVEHCIPQKRTNKDFIRKLGFGVGQSEKLRTLSINTLAYFQRLILEFIKWCGTILIATYYYFTLHPQKGDILFIFRYHVTKGLLQKH